MRAPISFTFSDVPADSGTAYPLDSTRRTISAATAAPGPYRATWAGGRVVGLVSNGDQAVTMTYEILVGVAGSSADWSTDVTADSGGVFTIAASTAKVIDWAPPAADYRIKIVAGSNNPSFLTCRLEVVFNRASAV